MALQPDRASELNSQLHLLGINADPSESPDALLRTIHELNRIDSGNYDHEGHEGRVEQRGKQFVAATTAGLVALAAAAFASEGLPYIHEVCSVSAGFASSVITFFALESLRKERAGQDQSKFLGLRETAKTTLLQKSPGLLSGFYSQAFPCTLPADVRGIAQSPRLIALPLSDTPYEPLSFPERDCIKPAYDLANDAVHTLPHSLQVCMPLLFGSRDAPLSSLLLQSVCMAPHVDPAYLVDWAAKRAVSNEIEVVNLRYIVIAALDLTHLYASGLVRQEGLGENERRLIMSSLDRIGLLTWGLVRSGNYSKQEMDRLEFGRSKTQRSLLVDTIVDHELGQNPIDDNSLGKLALGVDDERKMHILNNQFKLEGISPGEIQHFLDRLQLWSRHNGRRSLPLVARAALPRLEYIEKNIRANIRMEQPKFGLSRDSQIIVDQAELLAKKLMAISQKENLPKDVRDEASTLSKKLSKAFYIE